MGGPHAVEAQPTQPAAKPVLTAAVVVSLSLDMLDMPCAKYFEGAQFVHVLLSTTTVSLAIPIYKGFASLKGRMGVLMLPAGAVLIPYAVTGCLYPVNRLWRRPGTIARSRRALRP